MNRALNETEVSSDNRGTNSLDAMTAISSWQRELIVPVLRKKPSFDDAFEHVESDESRASQVNLGKGVGR